MNFQKRHLITALLVCWLVGIIAVKVSANELPGSPLYGIKTGWQQTRLALTFNQSSRASLINQFQAERKREITSLAQLHRSQVVNFTGKLTGLSEHEWVVDGLTLRINANTVIHGLPGIDDLVRVAIQTAEDGTLLALQVDPLTALARTAEPTVLKAVETLGNPTRTPIRQTPVSHQKTTAPTRAPDLLATQTPSPTGQQPLPTETQASPLNTATRVNTSTLPAPVLTLIAPRNTPVQQPTVVIPTNPSPVTQVTLPPPLPPPNQQSTPNVPPMPTPHG